MSGRAGGGLNVQLVPSHHSMSTWLWMTVGPTAAHASAVAHETLLSDALADPGGTDIGVTLHRLPFQLSAKMVVLREPLVLNWPTAWQMRDEMQLTLERLAPELRRRIGVRSAVQWLPFQLRANPSRCFEAPGPTAMHHVDPMHDTLYRCARRGLRMVRRRQLVPFQSSASADLLTPPTARQNLGEVQEIPLRKELRGLGACATFQPMLPPLSAIAVPGPDWNSFCPTARHVVALTQLAASTAL